jgi:hypothetical protein
MAYGRQSANRGTLIVALCGACSDPSPNEMCVGTVIQRDNVDFHLFDADPEEFCPSSFDAVASHVQWVADAWASEPSVVQYGLFESRTGPCWPCADEAGACGEDGRLGTTRIPDRHEVAHAARGLNCTSLVEEGWATLYSNPFEGGEMVGTLREAISGVEQEGRLLGKHYPLAARFVAFLLDSYGLEAVKQLCVIELTTEAELDTALYEVLGASLDQIQSALDGYPQWTVGALRQDQACEGADVLLSPISFGIELGCMAKGVEGKLGGPVWNHQLVELPEFGAYTFEFKSPQQVDLWIELRNCERDGPVSAFYTTEMIHVPSGTPEAVLVTELLAGAYVVRVMASEAPALDLAIEVTVNNWP